MLFKRLLFLFLGVMTFAVTTFSQSIKELNNQAIKLFEQKKVELAFEAVNHAIEMDSTCFFCYYNRAIMNRDLGNTDKAIQDFTTTIRLNPIDTNALMSRGIIYVKSQQYPAAIADFKAICAISPKNKLALFNTGLSLMNNKKFAEAERYFIRVTEVDSTYHAAFFRLAKIKVIQEDSEQAMEYINSCIRIEPENAPYYEFRGVLYFESGKMTEGCVDIDKAVSLGMKEERILKIQQEMCK